MCDGYPRPVRQMQIRGRVEQAEIGSVADDEPADVSTPK
jgi:hypothetical protein